MRKWMRERLKRRKKDPAKIEEKPVPLQPAYFEADATAPPASPDQPEVVPPHQTEREQIQAQEPRTQEPSTQSKAADPRRRRRRRGRGGRGVEARQSGTTLGPPAPQSLSTDARVAAQGLGSLAPT